jgi:hypothetical protein
VFVGPQRQPREQRRLCSTTAIRWLSGTLNPREIAGVLAARQLEERERVAVARHHARPAGSEARSI